jgi:hypothetical protein
MVILGALVEQTYSWSFCLVVFISWVRLEVRSTCCCMIQVSVAGANIAPIVSLAAGAVSPRSTIMSRQRCASPCACYVLCFAVDTSHYNEVIRSHASAIYRYVPHRRRSTNAPRPSAASRNHQHTAPPPPLHPIPLPYTPHHAPILSSTHSTKSSHPSHSSALALTSL